MLGQALTGDIFAFLLVLARIGAMMMVLPGFGEQYVLPRIRLALALALTALLLPQLPGLPPVPAQPFDLLPVVGKEILIGIAAGAVGRLISAGLHVAGTLIAVQSGLAMAQNIDPSQGLQSVVPANFVIMTGTTIIMVSDLHELLLRAVVESYRVFPPAGAFPSGDFAQLATRTVADAFMLGVQMAAPFLVYGIVFNVLLGVINRLMPAIQVVMIAMPLQVALSFLLFAATLGYGMSLFGDRLVAAFGPLIP